MQQSSLKQIYEDAVKKKIQLNPNERFNYYVKTKQYDKLSKNDIIEFLNTESNLHTIENLFEMLGKTNKRFDFIEDIILNKFKDSIISSKNRKLYAHDDEWLAWPALFYARWIIKDRWPEAEDIIKADNGVFRAYQNFLEKDVKK